MNYPVENDDIPVCPECGEELWYDEEEGCWVCDNCGVEYEEEWDEEEEEEL